MANSKRLVDGISERVAWMKKVIVVPGEFEMEALAAAGIRYLAGTDKLKTY